MLIEFFDETIITKSSALAFFAPGFSSDLKLRAICRPGQVGYCLQEILLLWGVGRGGVLRFYRSNGVLIAVSRWVFIMGNRFEL
jgi:hypothetical protein